MSEQTSKTQEEIDAAVARTIKMIESRSKTSKPIKLVPLAEIRSCDGGKESAKITKIKTSDIEEMK